MLDKQLEELTQRIAIEFYRAKSMMMGSVPVVIASSPLVGRIDIRNITPISTWSGMNQLSLKSNNVLYDIGSEMTSLNNMRVDYTNVIFLANKTHSDLRHVRNVISNSNYWGNKSASVGLSLIFKKPEPITHISLCDLPESGLGAKSYIIDVFDPDGALLVSHSFTQRSQTVGEVTTFELNIPN